MQDPPSPVALLQQSEYVGITKRVAPASYNSQEFRLRANPVSCYVWNLG
jgi:hypothetical protein